MLNLLAQGDSAWNTFFQKQEAYPVLLGGFVCLMVATTIIAAVWLRFAKSQAEMSLKQSMVERGMSVDEIERVLKARASDQ